MILNNRYCAIDKNFVLLQSVKQIYKNYMYRKFILSLLTMALTVTALQAQVVEIAGHVTDEADGKSVEFASVLMKENGLWAVTDANGYFHIKDVPTGKAVLTIQCLGYVRRDWPWSSRRTCHVCASS